MPFFILDIRYLLLYFFFISLIRGLEFLFSNIGIYFSIPLMSSLIYFLLHYFLPFTFFELNVVFIFPKSWGGSIAFLLNDLCLVDYIVSSKYAISCVPDILCHFKPLFKSKIVSSLHFVRVFLTCELCKNMFLHFQTYGDFSVNFCYLFLS